MTDCRNATASWSGYSHQGKVGLMLAIKEICRLLCEDECSFDEWCVEFESAEDIDIKNKGKVVSRHQVKAYINGTTLKKYEDVLNVQKYELIEGKPKLTTKGFQIRSFDKDAKPLEIEVDEESRYLHTICKVEGFDLGKCAYENLKGKPTYVENHNNVKLYKYPDGNEYCNVENNSCKTFCISLINKIMEIKDHEFRNMDHQKECIYLELLNELDTEIHINHGNNGYPNISFIRILEIVLSTIKHQTQNIQIVRSIFVKKLEEFLSDLEFCGISYTKEAIINAQEKVQEIYKLTDDDFFTFICDLNPDKKNLSFSKMDDVITICKPDDIKHMFFDCLLEVLNEDFIVEDRSYMRDGGYLLTLITDPKIQVNKTVNNIITNKNLTKCVFEKKYILNREIDELEWERHIGSLPEEITNNQVIKSNWASLKDEKKFYSPELSFMTYTKAKSTLKGE